MSKTYQQRPVNQDPNAGVSGKLQESTALNSALGGGGGQNPQTAPLGQNAMQNGPAQGGLGPAQANPNLNMAGLHGFDQANFYDPNMNSVKYKFARLAQKAGARTPSQMSALVLSPEFQQIFPGSSFNGKDWLDFNGALSDGDRGVPVGGIDVLMGADPGSDSAQGVWWGAPEGNPPGSQSGLNPLSQPRSLEYGLASQNQPGMQTQSLDDILRLLQTQQQGYSL